MNKKPTESKKWISSMIWSIAWIILIAIGIFKQIDSSVLSSMVYALGIIQGLYLGGQAAVDALVGKAKEKLGIQNGSEDSETI